VIYLNENDPYCADWLGNLFPAAHTDRRSILEVQPDDVRAFTRVHLFAGVGGWELALRLAGWPADRPVWTGSCPCQPFSAAGKQKGVEDARHLWPEFRRLVAECRPPTILGEQVASKLGRQWLAGVFADLEDLGYAVAGTDLCAAGVGAPHIRQRLYWCAQRLDDATGPRRDRTVTGTEGEARDEARMRVPGAGCDPSRLANPLPAGRPEGRSITGDGPPPSGSSLIGMAHTDQQRRVGVHALLREEEGRRLEADLPQAPWSSPTLGLADPERHTRKPGWATDGPGEGARKASAGAHAEPGRCRDLGWWGNTWLQCLDGKARRVEPSIFPLAHGIPGRVGRLRAYGNAIVPQQAAAFIQAVLASEMDQQMGEREVA
jgi:DNA (cytosine-5)-methyltransferase 1